MVFNLDFSILVIASIASLTIGLLTLFENPKQLTQRLFAILTISLVGWTTANYFSVISADSEVIFASVKAILVFVVLQNTCFFLLACAFPGNKIYISNRKLLHLYLSLSVATLVIGIYPGFFSGFETTSSSIVPKASPLMAFFILHTAISILVGTYKLYVRYKKSTGILCKQLKFLLYSTVVLLIITPLSNFVLPNVFEVTYFVRFSPVYTLAFASIIAYSMIQHKLFDFRFVVARTLGYLLSLGFIAIFISLIVYLLSETVRGTQLNRSVQSFIYALSTMLLVLTYPTLKRFFDKVTNSIFYRDAYDAEQFIGQLNKVVVSDIEIYSLLRKVVVVIEENLKVANCSFATVSHTGEVVIINDDPNESQNKIKVDQKLLNSIDSKHPVIVTDYLEDRDSRLKNSLNERDIGALVSLISKESNEPQQFSKVFMILGFKKSGNPYSGQDIRVLEIISNSLALAIQNALRFEEISRFNLTLQEKIDEATRELKRTNEKLRALDEAKDEFISMASHQLRTPLTSVKGYLSMVLDGDTGTIKASQRKLLQQAFESSQRMVFLIADLLNVSRLKTGKFIIEPRPVNLAEVIETEINQLTETAGSKRLKLTYQKPKNFPTLMLDDTKIRQVIMNFLDNAIYYTPSGGEINVGLVEKAKSVEYTVTDNGLGVPKKDQHHLFSKFYRAGNAKRMRPDGTGLGLFMAKKVIVGSGGAVIFSSVEGKGSTFGFSFPKQKLLVKNEE